MIPNALKRPKDGDLVKVCLVPFGAWAGHPMGAETYGPEEGAMIVAYFNRTYANAGKPMPIDYGHDSLYSGDAVAAGWVWSVEVASYPDEQGNEVPGVWGLVEWTPRARKGIEEKEYSGAISPVIDIGFPDPVTGETVPIGLFNAALTNMPFMLDKMPQAPANTRLLSLNSHYMYSRKINQGGTMDPKAILDKLFAAVGMKEGDDPNKLLEFIKKVIDFLKMAEGMEGIVPANPQEGDGAPPKLEELPPMEMSARACSAIERTIKAHSAADAKTLADVLGLLKCASHELLPTVATLKNGADPARFVAKADYDVLSRRLAEQDADALLVANEKKIPPADRDFWRTKAVGDLKGTKEILDRLANVLPEPKKVPVEDAKKPNTQSRPKVLYNDQPMEG